MNQQQRLQRLVRAEQRANRRDFDIRYGNQKRRPYGVVKPRMASKKDTTTRDIVLLAAMAIIVYVVLAV